MWVRTQLKIGWSDLLSGLTSGLGAAERLAEIRHAEAYFSDSNDTIAAYSVRSGFDLLLQALELKPGDEVIFSALNVRGMVKIVRDAGLVPVPVDLDVAHMGPSMERLKAAITKRSRVFVAAHLFGTRLDLDPMFNWRKPTGLPQWKIAPRHSMAEITRARPRRTSTCFPSARSRPPPHLAAP